MTKLPELSKDTILLREMTVGEALAWINKLETLTNDGVKVAFLSSLLRSQILHSNRELIGKIKRSDEATDLIKFLAVHYEVKLWTNLIDQLEEELR